MNPEIYLNRWQELKNSTAGRSRTGPPDPAEIGQLARQVALSFMDSCLYCNRYETAYIDLLCEMATAFDDADLNARVSGALFGIVVEGLCDEFEDMQVDIYDRVMCQIVAFCRQLPQGRELDARLTDFGCPTADSLLARAAALRKSPTIQDTLDTPEKILFLSRITIGADVAVTSILMQRFAAVFPRAEIVVLGNEKLAGIFGGGRNIRISPLAYPRHGRLIKRFAAWFSVLAAVEAEAAAADGRILVVDPDSRLTQLGILPVVSSNRYLFFNSRNTPAAGSDRLSLSELANEWANRVLPESNFCNPGVWIAPAATAAAAGLLETVRRFSNRLIAVNLGVGGNTRKRLNDDFEQKLLLTLLSEPDTTVILDCGAGAEEKSRARRLLDWLGAQGMATEQSDLTGHIALTQAGLVSVECGVGEIAAIIAGCDEFIGYDSACQHIAAAVGVPSCTIFAGSNNPRFVRRWHAKAKARSEIVHVDTLSRQQLFTNEDIIKRINYVRTNP